MTVPSLPNLAALCSALAAVLGTGLQIAKVVRARRRRQRGMDCR